MRKNVLITAGPTREYLDPIRYVTNESSGYLGYLLAAEAKRRNCSVVLITGNHDLPVLAGVVYEYIRTARDLDRTIRKHIGTADILFMTSAVCDFYPAVFSQQKIKRTHRNDLVVRFRQNKDILRGLSTPRIKKNKIYVGFCIETKDVVRNAQRKLREKNLDYLVANQHTAASSPFGRNDMKPVLLARDGTVKRHKRVSKKQFARMLVSQVFATFDREVS